MKNLYAFIFALTATVQITFAQGNCTIDSSNTNFFSPSADSLSCIERTVAYNQVVQISVPATVNLQDFGSPIPFILTVDSVVISGVNGLPSGITYDPNPASGVLKGGQRGCALLHGTTTDPAGHYPVSFVGTFTAHGLPFPPYFDGDTTIDFATLQNMGGSMFEMYVDVIEPGAPCRATSVGNFIAELNSWVKIYPNPNNGTFNLIIDAGRRVNGEIIIIDNTGRKVYSQSIDALGFYSTHFDLTRFSKGLYTVLVKTPEGIAFKKISVE